MPIYEKARNIQQNNPEIWLNIGNTQLQLKDFKRAKYSLETAILYADSNSPDKFLTTQEVYAQAYYGKGQALYESEKYQEALEAYNKALEYQSDYPEAQEGKEKASEKLR